MIHPTAIIDDHAEIDPTVQIGPYCTIGPKVKIGKNTSLQSHVVIDGKTTVGENNKISSFVVLGGSPQDLKYKGEETELFIGNSNSIREAVTINTGTVGGGGITRLGNYNLLMAYVHLGHDCIVGNHCILANSVGLAGHVTLDDYSNLGGMVGVSQYVRVGSNAYVTGQSGLEKSVPPFCIVSGSRDISIRGANIVGLRRKGFSAETIQKINEALKLWVRPEVQKEQCLIEIESQYGELEEIKQFIEFVRSSKQGVVK